MRYEEHLKWRNIDPYAMDQENYNGGQLMEGMLLAVYGKIGNGTFFFF